ncbi:hypothetical protein [Roseovarius indicus]|uniref:Tail protein n=1 Tax=Roseovarius indicus TaxID=540747 RepID=A0A0T5P3J6_9RHOB|nr:hypothetical protein [Roseovarius indicus]KRS15660.1 hypothetical protein XM52_22745 [Roseovarius indicus]QEW27829.1 hypothetical protein RIdsm_03649 [Roseovarius indicus]SFE79721.1 hypothetical protein SAMN04488031_12239 [Roseovarius indicus]
MTDAIAIDYVLRQAFLFMEVTPPTSFGDDSPKANDAAAVYDAALDTTLEGYDWSFARRVVSLAEYDPKPPDIADPELPYTVQLPDDCLALRKVYVSSCVRWRQDQRMIRLDTEPPVTVRYTFRNNKEKYLPRMFQTAIAGQLALLLAPKYVTTRAKQERLQTAVADAVSAAKTNDAHTASSTRIDGRPNSGDWATEAIW